MPFCFIRTLVFVNIKLDVSGFIFIYLSFRQSRLNKECKENSFSDKNLLVSDFAAVSFIIIMLANSLYFVTGNNRAIQAQLGST